MSFLSAIKYRNRAELALEPFQKDDQVGSVAGREAAFELFVVRLLEVLAEERHLSVFGVRVASQVQIERSAGEMTLLVNQRITSLAQGVQAHAFDIEQWYLECFPRNAVFDGEFKLSRHDVLVQRYVTATVQGDADECTAVIAILCRQAEAAFSAANIQFQVTTA